MDKINLKDILTGKLTSVPYIMDIDERFEFTQSLADALAAYHQAEFPEIGEPSSSENFNTALGKAWSAITDNFVLFMMNKDNAFSVELIIAAFIRAIRIHEVPFQSETDVFFAFYKKYSKWIVSGEMDFAPLKEKTAEDYEEEMFGDDKPTFGGNFTLRDHHISQAIHARIEKDNKNQ